VIHHVLRLRNPTEPPGGGARRGGPSRARACVVLPHTTPASASSTWLSLSRSQSAGSGRGAAGAKEFIRAWRGVASRGPVDRSVAVSLG
jgi:hypothetical protein